MEGRYADVSAVPRMMRNPKEGTSCCQWEGKTMLGSLGREWGE